MSFRSVFHLPFLPYLRAKNILPPLQKEQQPPSVISFTDISVRANAWYSLNWTLKAVNYRRMMLIISFPRKWRKEKMNKELLDRKTNFNEEQTHRNASPIPDDINCTRPGWGSLLNTVITLIMAAKFSAQAFAFLFFKALRLMSYNWLQTKLLYNIFLYT